MDTSKRGYILMEERLDLNNTQGASTPEEVKRMQNVPYASVVGSIIYAVRCTRPDVASHKKRLHFERWRDRFGKSSKKSTTAMSAIEAEYIAASEAAMEAVWIKKFISGLVRDSNRISLKGFLAQSVGSSNTDVLDYHCLLVLITGTSQSRQQGKEGHHKDVINTCAASVRQLDLMGLNPCRDSPYVMGFPVGESIVWALEVCIGVAMAHSSWVQVSFERNPNGWEGLCIASLGP
ncbi:hypothetical protein Tco_1167003 [Tanacetum coccineum]